MYWEDVYSAIDNYLDDNILYRMTGNVYHNQKDNCCVCSCNINNEKYYMKIFINKRYDIIAEEISFISYLRKYNVNVPDVLLYNNKFLHTVIVKGKSVNFFFMREMNGDRIITKGTLNDIMINIANIHIKTENYKIKHLGIKKICNTELLQRFISNDREFVNFFYDSYKLERLINKINLSSLYHIIHADLHIANIIIRKGNFYGLIDFSDFRLGHTEDDIGKIIQCFLTTGLCSFNEAVTSIQKYSMIRECNFKEVYISCIYHILYYTSLNKNIITDYNKIRAIINSCILGIEKNE